MKFCILVITMLIMSNLWAVTPQSMRKPQERQVAQKRTQTKKRSTARKRSTAKKTPSTTTQEQEPRSIVPPVEHYNAHIADQKTARKQYKKVKKQIKHKQAPMLDEDGHALTMSEMSYAQLCQRKNELILMGDYATAIRYLERMLRVIERPEQVMFIMLELAELFMKSENYRKAERMYFDFVKLYPSSQFAEQAYVKAIECSWLQTLPPDRDQTKTESTLALIEEFLTRGSIYTAESVTSVMAIQEKCRHRLAESTMLVVQQYVGHGQYIAAHKRIDMLVAELPKVPTFEPQLLHVQLELAQAEGKADVVQQLRADLQQRYPQYEITLAANTKPAWKRWLGV